MKRLFFCFFLFSMVLGYSQPARLATYNLDHFTKRERKITSEMRALFQESTLQHPDAGLYPFDGPPCTNCFEVIEKREANSRYFIEEKSNGKSFFIQQASSPINYYDSKLGWREINFRLEKKSEHYFAAMNQPVPVEIDLIRRRLILTRDIATEFDFPKLKFNDGENVININEGDISDYTAGDDGIYIRNYYKDIDLVFLVKEGRIESLFILNSKLNNGQADLVLRQNLISSGEFNLSPAKTAEASHQEIYLTGNGGETGFIIDRGYAYDNNSTSTPQRLLSHVNGDGFEFIVSKSWLNDPSTEYPVIIDPVIWAQNSLPVASITGTRYSAVCWTNSCDYFMSVNSPPNTTITGIYHSFEFYATGACFAEDGGYSLDFSTCQAPSAAPGVYTNPVQISNAYFTADTVLVPEFNSCIPAPQCASQQLDFTLHFYRCNNDTDQTCAANCVRATKPWIMYVRGETVTLSAITGTQSVCAGDTVTIIATPQYGVPPYTFTWSPGTSVIDTLTDAPLATTIYTVTVTDACANTSSLTTTVNVSPNTNPGFTINPNPACINEVITLNGNGAGAPTDYDWIVSGSDAPGGVINDNQNPTLSYTLPGTYDVILTFTDGSCVSNDTLQVTINNAAVADVSLSANPAGAVCQGDFVTFFAAPVNGGPAPNYEWLIDGFPVQNGPADTLYTDAFINGSLIQVIMTSNGACVSPAIDTASIFMTISAASSPQVTISPDTAVCDGSPLTLTASFTNGGPAPFIQWFSNGVPIPGANTAVYSFNVIAPDTVISVEVTSSLACVTNPVGTDTSIVSVLSNLILGIALFPSPVGTVCSGDTVVYTAIATNGGVPTYTWYINGVLSPNTDSVLTYVPNDDDSISVSLISSLTCVVNSQIDGFVIADVASNASPAVSLNVAPSASICSGDTVTFTASLLNGGSNPVYSWTINGVPAGANDSTLTTSTLNNNDVVQIIAASSLTCATVNSDTAAITVSVAGNDPATVTLLATPLGVCENDTIVFIAQPVNGGAAPVYEWSVNGVPNGLVADTVALTGLSPGDSVTVSLTSSLSCVSSGTVVSVPYISTQQPYVAPVITLSENPADSLCAGQEMVITATTGNGGTSPLINWYVNGILQPETSNVLSSSTFPGGSIIVARLISNEQCLSQNSDTSNFVRILYRGPLNVQLSIDSLVCPGLPVNIIALPWGGNGGPYNINWSSGETDTTEISVTAQTGAPVYVMVSDNCTALSASDTLFVPTLTGPVADFSYTNASPGSFQNIIQFFNYSVNADTWQWYFADSGSMSTEWNPVHQFPSEGQYEVVLYTQNNSGCIDSIVYTVIVIEDVAIYYPNTFTPNGDGLNENFHPIGSSLDTYEMTIYNRWGEVIYTGDETHPWSGQVKNSSDPAPEAVYVFRIDYGDERFGEKVVTGRVTLIR